MDVSVAIAPTSGPPAPSTERSKPLKCTGRVKLAIDNMVWLGLRRDDAAKAANLTIHGLREALRKPHVKAYHNDQLDVLRESGRARRILRLEEISEQSDNLNAAVNAIKTLDQVDSSPLAPGRGGIAQFPGFVIHVSNAPAAHPVMPHERTIENTPTISTQLAALPRPRDD